MNARVANSRAASSKPTLRTIVEPWARLVWTSGAPDAGSLGHAMATIWMAPTGLCAVRASKAYMS